MTSIPIADGNNGIMDENQSMANGQRENRESVYEDSSRDGSPYQSQGSKSLSESPTNTPMSEEQNARLIEVANKYGYHLVKENGQRYVICVLIDRLVGWREVLRDAYPRSRSGTILGYPWP